MVEHGIARIAPRAGTLTEYEPPIKRTKSDKPRPPAWTRPPQKRGALMDKFWQYVAERLPSRLAYFAAIRVGVYGTSGKYGNTVVPEVPFMEIIRRWER